MASVNKVILVGNVGRDAEIRYLPSGAAVANVTLATSSRRKDRNSGEMVEDTQWHRVQFFDRLAEIAGEYVKKGRPIYVEGRLKYGKYTDQSGVERNTVDIIATELQLLGGPGCASGHGRTSCSGTASGSRTGCNAGPGRQRLRRFRRRRAVLSLRARASKSPLQSPAAGFFSASRPQFSQRKIALVTRAPSSSAASP